MGDSILVISRQEKITPVELIAAIVQAGGYADADGVTGHMESVDGYIWIHLDVFSLEEVKVDYPQKYELVQEVLQDEPRTCINIQIHSTLESYELALRFAIACTEVWPCVVDPMYKDSPIFTREALLQIQKEGKTFLDFL